MPRRQSVGTRLPTDPRPIVDVIGPAHPGPVPDGILTSGATPVPVPDARPRPLSLTVDIEPTSRWKRNLTFWVSLHRHTRLDKPTSGEEIKTISYKTPP